jgi:UDP-N-acetylmuramoyl-L-alanyl-D-glutamate--2,6-diaminopimelate ligase
MKPIEVFSRTLDELARFVGTDGSFEPVAFHGVSLNSKEITQGDLFIALAGAKSHGASFAEQAVSQGAVAVVTDRAGAQLLPSTVPTLIVDQPRAWAGLIAAWFYRQPFSALDSIGVTGTNGKTTTASLVEQIWKLDGRSTGFIGTIGITVDGEDFGATHTTPEGTDLQEIVATMRERHVRNLVMEVSSHALVMHRVNGAKFRVAGFTNLTQDHLDFHGDMESYFQAKASLFTPELSELGIINVDDTYGARLFAEAGIPTKSVSRGNRKSDWFYDEYSETSRGFEVKIRGAGGILIEGELPLLGVHNLDNALLAIALVYESGVDPVAIASYLPHLHAPVGRLEPVHVGQKFLALVDYAHTPDAVERALSAARALTRGRVIAVLGCGGDRDKRKRPIMGNALRAGADLAIFTSDNPRSEDPLVILSEMLGPEYQSSQMQSHEIVDADRRSAIARAVLEAREGDCVIVLGKGHEQGQEIAGVKYPFDDRIELARAIEELS